MVGRGRACGALAGWGLAVTDPVSALGRYSSVGFHPNSVTGFRRRSPRSARGPCQRQPRPRSVRASEKRLCPDYRTTHGRVMRPGAQQEAICRLVVRPWGQDLDVTCGCQARRSRWGIRHSSSTEDSLYSRAKRMRGYAASEGCGLSADRGPVSLVQGLVV